MKLNIFGNLPIFLIRDPLEPLEAATKQYVDNNISDHSADTALHMTVAQNSFLDALTLTAVEANHLVGVTSGVQAQLDSKVELAGGVMTGFLTLSGDPTQNMQAATKQYVDTADNLLSGRVGVLETLGASLNADATTKTYVDAQDALKVAKSGDTMSGFLTL